MKLRWPRVPKTRAPRHRLADNPAGRRPDLAAPAVTVPRGNWRGTTGRYRGAHRAGRSYQPADPFDAPPAPPGRYRGAHRAGRSYQPADPFDAPPAPSAGGASTTGRLPMGQPPITKRGNPRRRFGPPERITDLAPAYRASGVPARTPAELARAEQRAADIRALAEFLDITDRELARRRRDAQIRGAVEQHDPTPPARRRTPPPARSAPRRATGARGIARRPPAPLMRDEQPVRTAYGMPRQPTRPRPPVIGPGGQRRADYRPPWA